MFTTVCNYSQIRRQFETFGALSPDCSRVNSQYSREVSKFIDTYDITLDVCLSTIQLQSHILNKMVCSFACPSPICYPLNEIDLQF